MKKIALSLLLIAGLGFVSCEKSAVSESEVSNQAMLSALNSLDGTTWVFTNYTKNKFASEFENKVSISFKDLEGSKLKFNGKSFVNNFFGSFTIDKSKGIIVDNQGVGSTLALGPEKEQKLEDDFYNNILKLTAFEVKGDKLVLYLGDKGQATTESLIFTKK